MQIQLNYYDWYQGTAKRQYEILKEQGIPVMVMEPVHGGMLAGLPEELSKLEKISRMLRRKIAVPCTGCRYCCDNCPQGLDIPSLLSAYNDYRDEAAASGNSDMAIWRLLRLKALPEENILSLFPVLYYNGNREINTISGGDYAKENRYSQSTDHRIRPDHHRTGL